MGCNLKFSINGILGTSIKAKGMRIHATLLIAVFLSIACKREMDEPVYETSPDASSTNNKSGLSFLALGDSYTIGHNVLESERWPVILANDLQNKNLKVQKPEIVAKTGWTTSNLLAALLNFKPTHTYDMVSLLIGVNNQYQGLPIEQFREEFHLLLLKSIAFADGKPSKVFVLSIPDWGVSKYGASFDPKQIGTEIDSFNLVAMEECAKEKVLFVNVTTISRYALNDPSMIASDGLHFSGKMYQLWVDSLIPQIKGKF